jgi:hypothetical protein
LNSTGWCVFTGRYYDTRNKLPKVSAFLVQSPMQKVHKTQPK